MDPTGRRDRALVALADVPAVALAVGVLGLFVWTFASRVGYPYDLEWMEGGMLLHARRVLDGLPIYVRPSPEFIPYIYPPLYSWVVAALGAVFGLGYPVARAVSFVGTVLASGALVAAARGERVPSALAVGAAGLYLSCYDNSGAFYDLVRIDGLWMALLCWSLVAVRHGAVRVGGLLLVAAFATKHNGAAFGLPALLWLWRVEGRATALRFAAWSVGPALAFLAVMELGTEGRFLKYLIEVPAYHPFVFDRFFPGTPKELFQALPWTTGLAVGVGLLFVRRASAGAWYWVAQGTLAIVLCSVMRGHFGGFINVLMPGHWALSLWAALAAGAVLARWPHVLVRAGLGAALALQIWQGRWSPKRYWPSEADYAAGRTLIERLSEVDGPILAPQSPFYPVLAGKETGFALIALWDIDHEGGPFHDDVEVIKRSLAERHWGAVLVGNDDKIGYGLPRNYQKAERFAFPGRALYTKTGWARAPRYLYLPRGAGDEDDSEPGPDERSDGAEAGSEGDEGTP